MCDPLTLGIAQGGLSLIGSASAVSAQNTAASNNRANSIQAMNAEQGQTTADYIEQNRSLIQGGFDAILEGRDAEATAYSSAVQAGAQGASVFAVLRNNRQIMGRNKSRTGQEMSSLRTQTTRQFDNIRAKAQGRINQVAPTGLNLGDFASALAPIGRAIQG